jgi:hypothetical protein
MRILVLGVGLLTACASDRVEEDTVASSVLISPQPAPAPAYVPEAINVGPGDQYDPHVSGDLVSYTSDFGIRYYRFSTGVDAAIPMGNSARDLLAGVSLKWISFSRVVVGVQTGISMFDVDTGITTEIDPAPGVTRIGSTIAGNTIGYVDYSLEGHGEMVVHQPTSPPMVRLTNDIANDANPMFSSLGEVIVWEHCATSFANCDIAQSVRTQTMQNVFVTWTSSFATSTPLVHEGAPDTNGTIVVYDKVDGPRRDICWVPVAGGAESCLDLPGYEAWPRIENNLIVFESRPGLFDTTDLWLYDVYTNFFYQITATPLVTEQLSDITILPDGTIHLVWTTDEDGFDQRNVWGATFVLPSSTLFGLISTVAGLGLSPHLEDQLLRFLDRALTATQAGNTANACAQLQAFMKVVDSQSRRNIPMAEAASMIATAAQIRASLGCP